VPTVTRTTQFKKDFKLILKHGYNTELLFDVVDFVLRGERLPERFRNHRLSGEDKDCWECHIKPDWLLIYRLEGEALQLVRTGTHSDLFE
jgi:mRNA interferase YafQ